ncbi:NAD-glutamate dehydrogenase [Pseudonocardia spinosispora]|uniref:NAD-glutamate dehydrogenase n=1 Tax=Pseudonocardia spinosispora TaxID=103441 RepID=UPI000407B8BE|nr:NAD-glutamate dehydrogenase [Pseudonocardia spinosispora]
MSSTGTRAAQPGQHHDGDQGGGRRRSDAPATRGEQVLAEARAADPGLADLCELYFRHTPPEDLEAAEPEQLLDSVRSHRLLAGQRTPGRPVLRLRDATGDHGRQHTVVEIVTDDMPFLVESVLAGIGRAGAFVQGMVHPIVVVRRGPTGELLEVLAEADPDAPPKGAQVESWMNIKIDLLGEDSAKERLADEVTQVLDDVREVVEDSDRMQRAALELAARLRSDPPPLDGTEVEDGARLLEWLGDNHFTFLGYRRYELDTSTEQPVLSAVLASGLGVLRGDQVSSTSFAPGSDAVERATARELLLFSQASSVSRVSRPVYPSYLSVKTFDVDGHVSGEHRFLGMLTVPALYESVLDIPVVERRVRAAIHRAGFPLRSYSGQRMLEVISGYPRDELFRASADELYNIALGVLSLAERRQLRLFLRRDPYRRFFTCLIYLPRDRYTTKARLAVQESLRRELGGHRVDYTARVTESSVALLHVTVHTDPEQPIEPDTERLQDQLAEAVQTWEDRVMARCAGSPALTESVRAYLPLVPAAYQEDFDAEDAVRDLARLDALTDQPDMTFYTPPNGRPGERRFKLYLAGEEVALTQLLPVLQQMGVEVVEERPYQFTRPDGRRCWIYDFGLRVDESVLEITGARGAENVRVAFCSAFAAAWRGDIDVDRFNALVLRAGLNWQQAALLRAYARYLRQIGTPYGQYYLADTLIAQAPVAAALVRLFEARFDPALGEADDPRRVEQIERRLTEVTAMIDEVTGLDADRILRGYLNLITSTLRTNYFTDRSYLALKFDPSKIRELPAPAPRFEIFVYSPRVEGVHLRFGPVARGGLRWSDRPADFRTEVLGLVKAQAVKNAVIVPVGAKGGFVVKNPPAPTGDPTADREATQAEGIACYKMLISGLLDLTDNRVDGQSVPPEDVVRHDSEDSYLVVAADKGTATFSDIANSLAVKRGFWLGDAFASGGSAGYDHKAMGITAKGAWESVKRSFRELGVDTQSQEFTVVGVGDMSGDVFGNGMLLSEHIRLLAAFDHRHVFVDPNPDSATSFAERTRMFALPRSSWADYDRSKISTGGGVWSRTAKAIPVSSEMRAALGLEETVRSLTPPELIHAILLAPADLLWNGGVGTYVKASTEANSEVGDKANDPVRVNGSQLRVKVVGEGGNLGLTQRGRIEFARAGGRINTDALDNSAGVDCSDHEVNIKIPLQRVIAAGGLTESDRNELLLEMTDDVSRLVLADNFSQNAVLGVSRSHSRGMASLHGRLVSDLESRAGLDRTLDVLPEPAGFTALVRNQQGLTSPELATLLAHVKLDLKAQLLDSDLPDAAVFADRLRDYFPLALRERFPEAVAAHPLRREIVTTQLVNEMVDGGGITFAFRLAEELSTGAADAVRAYAITTEVFGLKKMWAEIEDLDTGGGRGLNTELADELVLESRRLLDRAARWFLTNRPQPLAVGAEIARFGPTVLALRDQVTGMLIGEEADAIHTKVDDLVKRGVPLEMAERFASLLNAYGLLDIVEVTELGEREHEERDPREVALLYFALSQHLSIDTALNSVSSLERGNRWHSLARQALRDDLYGSLRSVTLDALRESSPGDTVEEKIVQWERLYSHKLGRARAALQAVGQTGKLDLATLSVVSRQLRGLSR